MKQNLPKPNNIRGAQAAAILAACAVCAPLVQEFEGRVLKPYLDPVGILTVCDGETSGIIPGKVYTPAECDAMLAKSLVVHGSGIADCIRVDIPLYTRGAFTSFGYNVGVSAFCNSTANKKLNAGDTAGACAELSKWIYAKGRVLPGLVKRRAKERAMCEKGLVNGGGDAFETLARQTS